MNLSDDQLREMVHQQGLQFRDQAPTSADQAAEIILKGVKDKQWRILVGDDAHQLDARVRRIHGTCTSMTFARLRALPRRIDSRAHRER